MTIEEVIAELEKASEGSETLDKQIALVLGWTYHPENARRTINWWIDADENERLDFPAWTRSLDAALTLVPEGHGWTAGKTIQGPQAFAEVLLPYDRGEQFLTYEVDAATPPIALCIAALRARSRQP